MRLIKQCKECSNDFSLTYNAQLYCSLKCRKKNLVQQPFICKVHGELKDAQMYIYKHHSGITVNVRRGCKACQAVRSKRSRHKIKAEDIQVNNVLNMVWGRPM